MKFLERSFDGQNQFWKYVLVFLGAFVGGQIIGAIPLGCVLLFSKIKDFEISKNITLMLMLIVFAAMLIILIPLIKSLHGRTFAETVNGTKKVRIKRCLTGAAVWAILSGLYFGGDYFINPGDYVLQFDILKFIPLVFITLIFIPFQTTCEELMFRGYLTQGFAQLTKSRWLAILIPALLFALLHSFNPEVKDFGFWVAMPQYVFFGLLFGLIAVMDDGIELSMGMHAANNILSCLLTNHKSSALQTDAVFEQMNINITKDTVSLVVIGIVAVIYFAIRYKWNFSILNTKVEPVSAV